MNQILARDIFLRFSNNQINARAGASFRSWLRPILFCTFLRSKPCKQDRDRISQMIEKLVCRSDLCLTPATTRNGNFLSSGFDFNLEVVPGVDSNLPLNRNHDLIDFIHRLRGAHVGNLIVGEVKAKLILLENSHSTP
jgi:hypothetical protein